MQASKQVQFFGAPPSDMSKSNPLYRLERALGVHLPRPPKVKK